MPMSNEYLGQLQKITRMLKDAAKQAGFVLHVNWIENASSVGYDAGIYLCEKERYEAEFGPDKEG